MIGDQNLLTILLTYSLIQGYILVFYCWLTRKNFFLTTLIAVISTQILVHLTYHFSWFLSAPHVIFVDGPLWYLIGPLFLLVTRSIIGAPIRAKEQIWHGLPFLIFLAYLAPFYILRGEEKIETFKNVFGLDTYSGDINHYFFSFHILVYLIFSLYTFRKHGHQLRENDAWSVLIFDIQAEAVLKYYTILWIGAFGFYYLSDLYYQGFHNYYKVFYLLLSALIHQTFYFSLIRKPSNGYGNGGIVRRPRYRTSGLTVDDKNNIAQKVQRYVCREEVYKNPNLRIREVADALKLSPHHISQSLNESLTKSFFDLVNEQRLIAVVSALERSEFDNYTITGVALEYGFGSPSSFHRIFKKHYKKTPRQFMNELARVERLSGQT